MNGCTVRVQFRAYRDCSNPISNITPNGTVFITADTGCTQPVPITNWINSANVEVTPVCPGTPTNCNTPGATFGGIMEHHWYRDYDFCAANCSTYTIYWSTCCRNSAITTMSNPGLTGLYTSTTFNPFLSPCNSTPTFTNPPIAYICQGQAYTFSQGATDPDGDSLSYTIGPCRRTATQGVPYYVFTGPTIPLGPDWLFTLDPATGDLGISPNPSGPNPGSIQVGVVCIYVTEWRGGIAINTIERDMQVNVIPCPPNNPPQVGLPNVFSGGSANGFTINTCLGATICADFRALDLDANQIKTLYWDQALAALGATFTSALNPNVTDTVAGMSPTGRFCWTPQAPGTYQFSISTFDDACPIVGQAHQTVTIIVDTIATTTTHLVSGCEAVSLCAAPLSGTPPFQYLWTGSGGLNTNPDRLDSCLLHTFPMQGTFPYTFRLTDAWGCTATHLDTITILNNVTALAGPDTSTCANQPVVIGGAPSTNPDLIYFWNPNLYIANNRIPQPTITLPNPGPGPRVEYFEVLTIDTLTQCSDRDTMRLTIYPIPSSPFILPDSACTNQAVALIYTGGNGPNATYQWDLPAGSPTTLSGQGPHQAWFTLPGMHQVSLTVTQNGCSSPIQRDTIRILPRPVASINPVSGQCILGNSFTFSSAGPPSATANYQWFFWPNASPSASNSVYPSGVTFNTPGIKRITLQLTENGCPGNMDTLLVQVFPNPDPNWTVIGGVQCFSGNQYNFQATGANSPQASYSWTFQDGIPSTAQGISPVISFNSPGRKGVTMQVTENGCTTTRIDTIEVFPEPVAHAGPDVAFCAGDGGAILQGSGSQGTGPYYYAWTCAAPICGMDSLHDDDPLANPTSTTLYYLQVIDVNGCEGPLDSAYVTVHPKPVVDAGPDRYICGDSAPCQVLTPTVSGGYGPYSYLWLPANGLNSTTIANPCARPDTTTIYALVASDIPTGCTSEYNTTDTLSTVTVHVHPTPLADAGPDLHLCPGDTGILVGTGTSAGPAYTYQWTPATGLSNPNSPVTEALPPATHTYSLVVTSNGCPSYADQVTVHLHTTPSVDAGWDREICLGESTLLDAHAAGDSTASYTFTWSQQYGLSDPHQEDPIASPPSTTTYYVVATSNWGCQSPLDSVEVRLRPTPVAEAGPNLSVCEGDSIRLLGQWSFTTTDSAPSHEVSFQWNPGYGLSDPGIPQPSAFVQASGWYHFAATRGLCTTRDSTYITFVPDLHAQALADTNTLCAGDTLHLHAGGGLGNPLIRWEPATLVNDPAAPMAYAIPQFSGSYTLYLSEAGCADTATLDINVLPRPEAAFTHSLAQGCAPHAISLLSTSSGANFLWWDFGDGSPVSNEDAPTHTYAQPGTYQVSLHAASPGNCRSTSPELTITVLPPPVLALSASPEPPATLTLPLATLQLRQTAAGILGTYWDFGDGIRAEGPVAEHTFTSPGIYEVTVHGSSPEGCTTTERIGPFIVLPPELHIPNVFSPNGDGIVDFFSIDYTGDQPFLLQIRDRWGSLIHQTDNKLQGWDGLSNGQQVPEGTYFYLLSIGSKEYVGALTLIR